jgi:hypothetical protein
MDLIEVTEKTSAEVAAELLCDQIAGINELSPGALRGFKDHLRRKIDEMLKTASYGYVKLSIENGSPCSELGEIPSEIGGCRGTPCPLTNWGKDIEIIIDYWGVYVVEESDEWRQIWHV